MYYDGKILRSVKKRTLREGQGSFILFRQKEYDIVVLSQC